MKTYYEQLLEYNQRFVYHFTGLDSLKDIFDDGGFFPFYDKKFDNYGLSTTRNKNFKWLKHSSEVRITFDYDKLKTTSKSSQLTGSTFLMALIIESTAKTKNYTMITESR
jgi:hypothetical protein